MGFLFFSFSIQVTWVEHADIEDKPVHQIFNNFVNSGMAFGAPRWLAVLQRQCERVASLMARNISDLGGLLFFHTHIYIMRFSSHTAFRSILLELIGSFFSFENLLPSSTLSPRVTRTIYLVFWGDSEKS